MVNKIKKLLFKHEIKHDLAIKKKYSIPKSEKIQDKENPSQKTGNNGLSAVERLVKMLEDAHYEIKSLREENDRLKKI
ncbi:hypothetical protein [Flavobacterium piscis]|uniref:Uncharacterized protein n=1 Tax=Flavobacterium piscis TaxID=1114874 RepID=A0ABU1YAS7_9FLAO|nr:hypothetical protein [Flavobacterium piscis]MDR7211332.1 hypothetical protein [Flavobacterium piscis]